MSRSAGGLGGKCSGKLAGLSGRSAAQSCAVDAQINALRGSPHQRRRAARQPAPAVEERRRREIRGGPSLAPQVSNQLAGGHSLSTRQHTTGKRSNAACLAGVLERGAGEVRCRRRRRDGREHGLVQAGAACAQEHQQHGRGVGGCEARAGAGPGAGLCYCTEGLAGRVGRRTATCRHCLWVLGGAGGLPARRRAAHRCWARCPLLRPARQGTP